MCSRFHIIANVKEPKVFLFTCSLVLTWYFETSTVAASDSALSIYLQVDRSEPERLWEDVLLVLTQLPFG